MKAAVFEYVWDPDPVLTTADRELIMPQDRPPVSVRVRLSSIESDGYPLQARGLTFLVRETGEKIMCLTMTIGGLVIQVFGAPGPDAGADALRSAGRTGPDFAAIFPPQAQPARWPPQAVPGDESLSAWALWVLTRCATRLPASKDAQQSTDGPGRHDVSLQIGIG